MEVIHPDAYPRRDATRPARFCRFRQPIHPGVNQVLVQSEECLETVKEVLHFLRLHCTRTACMTAEEFPVAPAVTVQNRGNLSARVPRTGGVGVDYEGVDAGFREQLHVTEDRLRLEWAAGGQAHASVPTLAILEREVLRLPLFRVVEESAGVPVEEVAVPRPKPFSQAHPGIGGARSRHCGCGRRRGSDEGGQRGACRC